MGRCWGCCQENCGYTYCSCTCHNDVFGNPPAKADPKYIIDLTRPEPCPCKEHRRYQAKRKPRVVCELCWRYYIKRNP